ncbi:MAG: hypothetical protein RLZZ582_1604 [Verrucomicrobiota bacterium]
MLNKITILQRVGIPVVADWLMVGSRTSAIREISSVQGIKLNLRLHRIRPGQTSNFAIIPSTADDTKDSDLFGAPPLKPSTKPPSGRDKTTIKQTNPTLNRTYSSVLRRPRNFSPVKVGLASKKRTEERVFFVRVFWTRKALVKGRRGRCGVGCGCRRLR